MNDLKELADYVVNNPDAYEYRWRLAKKLYMAWEYNEALKHLLILKKNWTRKLNVLRYLAATYYRLGRYDEAVRELDQITAQWPSEVPAWEQLAKVHEATENSEKAAAAWEEVLRLDPDHSIASRAVRRLHAGPQKTPRSELRLTDSDSGIDLSAGRVCENCGAQNSEEFDRCWQCHASLLDHPQTPSGAEPVPETPSSSQWVRPLVGGLLSVTAFSAAVYVGLSQLPVDSNVNSIPSSVNAALAGALYWPRLAVGGALLLCCPILLLGFFRLLKMTDISLIDACGGGILAASLTYLLLWTPVVYQRYAFGGPAVATAIVALLFVPGGCPARLVSVWLLHSIVATALGIGVWLALAGQAPIREWPDIERFTGVSESVPLETSLPTGTAPFRYSLIWASTGSPWLDSICGKTLVTIDPENANVPLGIQFTDSETVNELVNQPPYQLTTDVVPGRRYVLQVTGPEDAAFQGTVRGLLASRAS